MSIVVMQQESAHKRINISMTINFELSLPLTTGHLRGMYVSPDGTKLFFTEYGGAQKTYRYDMNIPFDLSTASIHSSIVTGISVNSYGITFSPNGETLLLSSNRNYIHAYQLTTPWDLSTRTAHQNEPRENYFYPDTLSFSGDGMRLFVAGNLEYAEEYALSAPYDINGITKEKDHVGAYGSLSFIKSGQYFFRGSRNVQQLYRLTTPYNITNGYRRISKNHITGELSFMRVSNNGKDLYGYDATAKSIVHYQLTYDQEL